MNLYDCQVTFKIVGLSMGEYTLPTGVELHMELCEVTNEPIILAPFIFTLFPTKVCPPEPVSTLDALKKKKDKI